MAAKELHFNVEARAALKRGVDQLAEAVKVTLGPRGRNVVIDKKFGAPTITKDGVTVADLAEQTKFSLKVRDALAEARGVQTRVRQAIDAKRGDQSKLQGVWDRLTTKSGPYEDQMFVDQLSNVNRAIGQADQKVGASYYERFNQLMKEWTSLKGDAEVALR